MGDSNLRESPDQLFAAGDSGRAGQLTPGEIIGARYRIIRLIGSGGMGEVYEVEHLELGQRSALKVLRSGLLGQAKIVERFHREARAMAKVQSSHVTRIMDCGALESGIPFFVMELLSGSDLSQLLSGSKPLSVDFSLGVVLGAARGLSAIHDVGLVHRDIKPANLFVTPELGGEPFCKVLDFGVIKSELSTSSTGSHLVGTLRYMAPEQLDGREVDARTDIYALSAVLYECLAGHPPHQGDRLERVLFSIMNESPRPLAEVRPDIPVQLSSVVARAMARKPEERFGSVREYAEALRAFATRSHSSTAATAWHVAAPELPARPRLRSIADFGLPTILVSVVLATALAVVLVKRPESWQASPPIPSAAVRATEAASEGSPSDQEAAPPTGRVKPDAEPVRPDPRQVLDAAPMVNRQAPTPGVSEPRKPAGPAVPSTSSSARPGLIRVGSESTSTSIDPKNPYVE